LTYHRPFKVHLPNKSKYQNRFDPDNKGDLVWPEAKEGTGVGVYNWHSKMDIASFLGSTPGCSRLKFMPSSYGNGEYRKGLTKRNI